MTAGIENASLKRAIEEARKKIPQQRSSMTGGELVDVILDIRLAAGCAMPASIQALCKEANANPKGAVSVARSFATMFAAVSKPTAPQRV